MSIRRINLSTGQVEELLEDAPSFPEPQKTAEELEAEVQSFTDQIMQGQERMMALALATVDLRMADVTGLTTAQVRQAFRDRVVFYLRQRRGL